jgi:hypothetical protein
MSNNKLKENKQMLYEASGFLEALPFIWIGLTALVGWAFTRYKAFGRNSSLGVSERAWDSINYLYKDKEFVKDFVNILKKESNLSDIVNKSITQFYKDTKTYRGVVQRGPLEDTQDWQGLIRGNIKGEGFDLDAKRIAIEVIKSKGYKKFSKKYKFSKEDDEDMFTVIYYIITRPDFANTAEKYLYTAASNNRNVPVPPLAKGSFQWPTGG